MSGLFGNHIVGFPMRRLKYRFQNRINGFQNVYMRKHDIKIKIIKLLKQYGLNQKVNQSMVLET